MEKGKSAALRLGYKSRNNLGNDLSQLGKLPPQATDLEEAILGALMLEKDALTNVIDILRPESFYKEAHQVIYQAIYDLFQASEPIDILTVTSQLRKEGKIEMIGGPYYITQLTNRVSSAANIEYHARIVVEQSIKRELIRISSDIQREAFEDTTDVFQLLDKMEQSLFEVSETNIRKEYQKMKDIMTTALEEIHARRNHKDGLTGIPSGFTSLDRVTSGWQKSDLVIIAARPAMGKTAFVVSALRNAAVDHGHAVAIFSLEMSSVQLVNRLISGEAELEGEKIKKGNLAEHEWAQLVHKTANLTKAPIFIDDTPALSILGGATFLSSFAHDHPGAALVSH
uniref:replicative DNA helicase n=1 Tax=uncultured Roseivirga sp. TaxID=543088 RepID=UPI0030D71DED